MRAFIYVHLYIFINLFEIIFYLFILYLFIQYIVNYIKNWKNEKQYAIITTNNLRFRDVLFCDFLGEIYELRRAAELLLVMQKVGFFKTVFIGVAVGALNSKLRSKRVKVAEHYIGVIIQITGKVQAFYNFNNFYQFS